MVVAAGSGRRFGSQKQFLPLAGAPVISWSLRAARSVSDGIVLVVPGGASGDPAAPDDVPRADVERVVTGGGTRAESVRCGIAVVPDDAAVIVIHDAARPLASAATFAAVVDAVRAGKGEGAIPVLPVADTLKRITGGVVTETVDRSGLVLVQTPQAFAAASLRAAHLGAADATDDAALLERIGATVCTVEGDPRNLKLTRPEDLSLAEVLLGAER